jgi:O-antigen/teichoic acid export membrane protein
MQIVRRLWPNARKFGVMSLGAYLVGNANMFICSNFLGVATTASFGLTVQVGNFLMSLSSLWLAVKWPQITILRTHGQAREMSVVFARRLLLVMGSYVFLMTLVLLLANPLLEWKGSHTGLLDTPALLFYLGYLGCQLFYVQFGMLVFTENVIPFFKISLYTGLGLVALSLIMTSLWGIWGMLLSPLIAEWTCSGWYTIRRGLRGQPLKPAQLCRAALTGRL